MRHVSCVVHSQQNLNRVKAGLDDMSDGEERKEGVDNVGVPHKVPGARGGRWKGESDVDLQKLTNVTGLGKDPAPSIMRT
ncbi:hypothetical protein CVT26_013347 [Gymnopilus dilepis]|uniref:Uncharacterized protein n=1 Tax=Gymnopilus dilepis TaxID=231916 RepID=A0A409X5R9_9AGAR|nr:hypothetical protein CVT26_013347 [Gymnopilus dilepis]